MSDIFSSGRLSREWTTLGQHLLRMGTSTVLLVGGIACARYVTRVDADRVARIHCNLEAETITREASLEVLVLDGSDTPIPGVTVLAASRAGVRSDATTTADGRVTLPVAAGPVAVRELTGFHPLEVKGLAVRAGCSTSLTVRMQYDFQDDCKGNKGLICM